MPDIDLLTLFLYVLISILLTSIFSAGNKWKGLLISSLLFYYLLAGSQVFFLILFAAGVYASGFLISRYPPKSPLMITVALMPLLLSKITDQGFHFQQYTDKTIGLLNTNFLLITGISYFTFNSISYLIDIKRKYIQPEENFFMLLLYLIYFPCILSGPLHRVKYLKDQFQRIKITDTTISSGLRLILLGLFKNMIIAKRLFAILQNLLASDISGAYYLICGLLFFFYLYFNFSSFIDLFQGVSGIFGINLKDNFRNRIYLSTSRQHFWKGWHITLNEWFRDYFFFAVAKHDRKRKYTNGILLITFLLTALWHELTIVFLVWGFLNGIWIILEKKINLEQLPFPEVRQRLGPVYHLLICSLLALIFISPSLLQLSNRLLFSPSIFPANFFNQYSNNIIVTIAMFIVLDYHYAKAGTTKFDEYLGQKPLLSRWFVYLKFALLIMTFGINGGVDNYYIQF